MKASNCDLAFNDEKGQERCTGNISLTGNCRTGPTSVFPMKVYKTVDAVVLTNKNGRLIYALVMLFDQYFSLDDIFDLTRMDVHPR